MASQVEPGVLAHALVGARGQPAHGVGGVVVLVDRRRRHPWAGGPTQDQHLAVGEPDAASGTSASGPAERCGSRCGRPGRRCRTPPHRPASCFFPVLGSCPPATKIRPSGSMLWDGAEDVPRCGERGLPEQRPCASSRWRRTTCGRRPAAPSTYWKKSTSSVCINVAWMATPPMSNGAARRRPCRSPPPCPRTSAPTATGPGRRCRSQQRPSLQLGSTGRLRASAGASSHVGRLPGWAPFHAPPWGSWERGAAPTGRRRGRAWPARPRCPRRTPPFPRPAAPRRRPAGSRPRQRRCRRGRSIQGQPGDPHGRTGDAATSRGVGAPGRAAAGCAPRWRRRRRSRRRGCPRTGISATLQADVDGQGHGAVAQAEPAAPGHEQHRVDRSARRRQEHGQRQDQHHVGRDVVPLAEDAHQRGREAGQRPGRAARRRSCSRAWRPGRPSWRRRVSPRANRAAICGESACCTDWTNSCPSTMNRVAAV